MLSKPAEVPSPQKEIRALICWFDERPMNPTGVYFVQHGSHRAKAKALGIHSVVDVVTLTETANPPHLKLNEIGEASFKLAAPVMADPYAKNPANGSFILIDEWTNNTVGVGLKN
jgi:sulfate adenylyltransferase subunit 1